MPRLLAHAVHVLALAGTCAGIARAQEPQRPPGEAPSQNSADDRILEGRVIDLRGEPVPSARIEARSDRGLLAETRGDGFGVFRLRLPAGSATVQIQATAPGYCWTRATAASHAAFVEFQLHEAAVVRGVLRDPGGAPIANAPVRAAHASPVLTGADVRTETDRDGRFALDKVPLGPVEISAWVAGAGLARTSLSLAGDAEVELTAPRDPGVTMTIEVDGIAAADLPSLRLEASSPVGVLTRRWAGPLDGASAPSFDFDERERTATLVVVGLPDVDYRVDVRAPGYLIGSGTAAAPGPHRVRLAASEIVRLEHRFEVDLENRAGQPLPGIGLVLHGDDERIAATTDAAGRATFDTAFPSTTDAQLEIRDGGWSVVNRQRLPLSDGRARTRYRVSFAPSRLVVERAAEIAGRIELESGEAAPFVPVSIQCQPRPGADQWQTLGWTLTDRLGNYQFGQLPALPVRVCVACRWGHAASETIQTGAKGEPIAPPAVVLAAPVSVEGVVRDAGGRPAPGILIQLASHGEQDTGPVLLRQNRIERPAPLFTISDRQGRFRFFGPVTGDATLSAVTLQGIEVGPREIEISGSMPRCDLILGDPAPSQPERDGSRG